MTRVVSVATMIEQIDGLRGGADMLRGGSRDLSEWEEEFTTSIVQRYHAVGKDTTQLSDKQVASVERIWRKHFA